MSFQVWTLLLFMKWEESEMYLTLKCSVLIHVLMTFLVIRSAFIRKHDDWTRLAPSFIFSAACHFRCHSTITLVTQKRAYLWMHNEVKLFHSQPFYLWHKLETYLSFNKVLFIICGTNNCAGRKKTFKKVNEPRMRSSEDK